jgi:RNA polymerase sigma-70 factor (ECF subfamily)
MVLRASASSSPQSAAALAALCESYWYPLYAFARRQGHDSVEAQDLTQSFFARLLEKRDLAGVDRGKGRFRAFLLASLRHFLLNEWDKARAAKRGGGLTKLALDFDAAEGRYRFEPSHERTAEAIFDRAWALTMLDQVRARVRSEYEAEQKQKQLELLQTFLSGDGAVASYREVGQRLGMTEAAVKVAVHRLRRRFRELLREEISHTVASEQDIDDEIRDLFDALRT